MSGQICVDNPIAGETITLHLFYNIPNNDEPGTQLKFIDSGNSTTVTIPATLSGTHCYSYAISIAPGSIPADANTLRVQVFAKSGNFGSSVNEKSDSFGPCGTATTSSSSTGSSSSSTSSESTTTSSTPTSSTGGTTTSSTPTSSTGGTTSTEVTTVTTTKTGTTVTTTTGGTTVTVTVITTVTSTSSGSTTLTTTVTSGTIPSVSGGTTITTRIPASTITSTIAAVSQGIGLAPSTGGGPPEPPSGVTFFAGVSLMLIGGGLFAVSTVAIRRRSRLTS